MKDSDLVVWRRELEKCNEYECRRQDCGRMRESVQLTHGFHMRLKLFGLRLWDSLHFISGEGSWTLRPYESALIEAAVAILPTDVQTLVRAQLKQSFFVERIPDGRINVIRFYGMDENLRISYPQFGDCLLEVHIDVEGKRQTAHVTFFKGFIFSVELRQSGKFYERKTVTVVGVNFGEPGQTFTGDINRREHGVDGD